MSPEVPLPSRKHKLLDGQTRKRLPEHSSAREKEWDAVAQAKFFTPDSNWYWYATEYDGKDLFFGLVVGHEIELGQFALSELDKIRGPMGLPVERDRYFAPKTLRELKVLHNELRARQGSRLSHNPIIESKLASEYDQQGVQQEPRGRVTTLTMNTKNVPISNVLSAPVNVSEPGKSTPLHNQYSEIKRQWPDAIVFFRLGDFYETFGPDAEIIAGELDVVLTSRNISKSQRISMAGVPYSSAESYIAQLIQKGYHVAICEQVGNEPINGLIPREVVRVVQAGETLEPPPQVADEPAGEVQPPEEPTSWDEMRRSLGMI